MAEQRCSQCTSEVKPLTEFYRDRTQTSGYGYRCKPCGRIYSKRWREANPERHRAQRRVWAAANPERERENQRVWREANPRYHFAYRLRAAYGIDVKTYDSMVVAQAGRCGICDEPMIEPCVDHCHKTEVIRELLCRPCNLGIGNLDDDLVRLRAAVAYLERHQ